MIKKTFDQKKKASLPEAIKESPQIKPTKKIVDPKRSAVLSGTISSKMQQNDFDLTESRRQSLLV